MSENNKADHHDDIHVQYEELKTPKQQRPEQHPQSNTDRLQRSVYSNLGLPQELKSPGMPNNGSRNIDLSANMDVPVALAEVLPQQSAAYLHDIQSQVELYKCSRGQYPELWYKFKRFETLGLLNIYHYQHELIQLEKEIDKAEEQSRDKKDFQVKHPGVLTSIQLGRMRRLMKEYCELLHSILGGMRAYPHHRRSNQSFQGHQLDEKTLW